MIEKVEVLKDAAATALYGIHGGDPETATTGSILSGMENRPGMDYGSYPMARKIVFGVSIRF